MSAAIGDIIFGKSQVNLGKTAPFTPFTGCSCGFNPFSQHLFLTVLKGRLLQIDEQGF